MDRLPPNHTVDVFIRYSVACGDSPEKARASAEACLQRGESVTDLLDDAIARFKARPAWPAAAHGQKDAGAGRRHEDWRPGYAASLLAEYLGELKESGGDTQAIRAGEAALERLDLDALEKLIAEVRIRRRRRAGAGVPEEYRIF
jgi:hypothetical protein